MTKRPQSNSLMRRIGLSGGLVAVAALTALMVVGPPGYARAATGTGYDQITGAGTTDSAVTVSWKQGLLDSNNQPITAENAVRSTPSGPLAFMYQDPDFQNLQVTVSQTQDITHQGITVTWQGGSPTIDNSGVQANFLQLMECYGDASTGPSPQDCEFGSLGFLNGSTNSVVGLRAGDLCAVNSSGNTLPANTAAPPSSLNGDGPIEGCDPQEPVQGASPADIDPNNPQQYTIPFVPVNNASSPAYAEADVGQYFNVFNSNEVQEAVTGPNGTGQLQFETLTGTQAPGLGCGQAESNNQTRNCWLVIVPRGEYEPNGFQVNTLGVGPNAYLYSTPLSASNWAMRIQIHLAYAPVPNFCPISTQETETIGTQVIERAVQSWQLALNQAANCTNIYGYSAVPEATSTQQLANSGSGSASGLAFTTIPIGSEAARDGTPSTPLPPILYAPVAVTAVGVGFNINEGSGYISTPIKLTPELLAKSLTQVYRTDLADYYPNGFGFPGPTWSQSNPLNISEDPQFAKLNPEVQSNPADNSFAPLLTEDHSALNQQVWQWIQADPAASAWLNHGTTDATNAVTADPDYTALQLGTPPAIDSFPRAYSGILDLGPSPSGTEEIRRSLDLLPYVNSYDDAAADVVTADTTATTIWDPSAVAPDGSAGWWQKVGSEPIGHILIWGISDTPDLAGYGLIDAQLCDDAGNNCVGPSTASLTTALASAAADSAGLLQVDPADPGAGGYPLTQVVYAAVATDAPATELSSYANLIAYAVGSGQTPGVAPGNLPPGYLPLPANLQTQAMDVVSQLRADALASSSPSPAASSGATSGTNYSGGTGAPGGTGTGPANIGGQPTTSPTPGGGPSLSPPSAELAATRTQRQPVGAVRWALFAVFIAGAACAVGGTALRSTGVARWLRRMRP